jgi:ribosome-associated translation inhibitor RaiA
VCEVRFAQIVRKGTAFNTCTITFTVGKAELRAEETTLHMYAALDIAAVQVERQLADFVATQHKHRLSTRLKRHFRRDAD